MNKNAAMKSFPWLFLVFLLSSCTGMKDDDAVYKDEDLSKIELLNLQIPVIDHALVLGDNSRAISLASKGLEIAEQFNDKKLILSYRRRLAIVNSSSGNFRQSAESYLWINEYSKETRDDELRIYSSIELGRVYRGLNLIDKALSCYLDAYMVQSRFSKTEHQLGLIFQSLGIIFERLEEYDKAIHFYHMSIDASQKTNNPYIEVISMCYLANCLFSKNEIAKVRTQLKQMKQLSISKPLLDVFDIYNSSAGDFYIRTHNYDSALYFYRKAEAVANLNLDFGRAAIIQTRIAHVYTEMKMWDMALTENSKALQNRLRIGNFSHASSSYANIGMNYFELGNLVEAEKALIKGLNMAKKMESTEFTSASYSKLLAFYIRTNNSSKAYEYSKTVNLYKDSLLKAHQRLNISLIYNARNIETSDINDDLLKKHSVSNIYIIIAVVIFLFLTVVSILLWLRLRKSQHAVSNQREPVGLKNSQESSLVSGIVESLSVGAYITDRSKNLIYCNQMFAATLGYIQAELTGRNILEITTNSQINNPHLQSATEPHDKPDWYQITFRTINGALIRVNILETNFNLSPGEIGKLALIPEMSAGVQPKQLRTASSTPVEKLVTHYPSINVDAFDQIYRELKEISSGTDRPPTSKVDDIEWVNYFNSIDNQLHKIENLVADNKQIALIQSGQTNSKATEIPLSTLFKAIKQKVSTHLSNRDWKNNEIELKFSDGLRNKVFLDLDQFSLIICRLCDYYLTEININNLMLDGSITTDNQLFISFTANAFNSPSETKSKDTSSLVTLDDAPDTIESKPLPVIFSLVKSYVDKMNGRFWFVSDPDGIPSMFIAIPCLADNL